MIENATPAPAADTNAPAAAPRRANFPQRGKVHDQHSGTNFSLARVGAMGEMSRYGVFHPAIGRTIPGKLFLHELLGLTGMEISVNVIPPQQGIPFYHKHKQNEEVYLFLTGRGQFQVDEEVLELTEGTVVRVAPDGVRSARNTSDVDMFYVCIQAKAGSLEQWTGTDGIGVPGEVRWPAIAASASMTVT